MELVRLLLERGADREHRDKKSHTPLHTAVYANQRAVVALLLDYGADIEAQVDRTKDTALSIACSHGRLEVSEPCNHPSQPVPFFIVVSDESASYLGEIALFANKPRLKPYYLSMSAPNI